MLICRNVEAGYGGLPVLKDISFTVNDGEAVAIFGHNGAGKTTLLKCASATWPACRAASATAMRRSCRAPCILNVRRGIGFVPQGHNVFRNLSVRKNLAIAGLEHGGGALDDSVSPVPDPRRARRADRRLAVSGGQQQILALGMALMTEPRSCCSMSLRPALRR